MIRRIKRSDVVKVPGELGTASPSERAALWREAVQAALGETATQLIIAASPPHVFCSRLQMRASTEALSPQVPPREDGATVPGQAFKLAALRKFLATKTKTLLC